MAPPSPRRSSRARATTSQSQHSSGSSVASGRADRQPRTAYKVSSGKSTPSASLSSEPPEDLDDTLLGRRRKRGQDDDDKSSSRLDTIEMAHISDDLEEEDEAVRCICGSEDYPGCPPTEGADADFFSSIDFNEDVTGFFVQCDICKVWQHGACVGIFSAESSPDEYFCEQCRKDLHNFFIATNGQKYSKYVPLHQISQATSRAGSVSKEGTRSPKPGSKNLRPTSSQASKRRSTMNSRDAAYDDEQLRKAIEASKEENIHDTIEGALRRTKRGRSESEENTPIFKRLRTDSASESPLPEPPEEAIEPLTEDEAEAAAARKARSSRHQPLRTEKDEKEKLRIEAANKRKGRAERRRGDESDPSEEVSLAVTRTQTKDSEEPPPPPEETPAPPQPIPGTPPTSHPATSGSHKRVARSHHKKSKGKNQYTKDRDVDREDSPARSMSRDIPQKNADEYSITITSSKSATHDTKHNSSKTKSQVANKMSMLDMKRRVAAIMDFISRTQVDLAAEGSIASSSNNSGGGSPQKPAAQSGAPSDKTADDESPSGIFTSAAEFRDLGCVEMMDVLTRDMVKWQNHYT